ncbi:putative subunit of the GINS complex [Hyphopichia burtonii NRRL Y-1933]|uniref:DNA replication complex GINS protein SLD5 n=1 Tax=Hyphopichia burtonii NRRL Y-1933 TaxID=984485 RepID=A0A1E4RGK0_9ASCO|nr:putative subunit of the GINS complex [Hyphopichia burtonii NRRL Y-1933]ODV66397.1 putative subunit of the GINS complex [Hyphopichia burtonii NRRL Y-1933]
MADPFLIDDILNEFDPTLVNKKNAPKRSLSEELVTAMLNERMAPELLPYKHTLMDLVLQQISSQQQYLLDSHEYGDSNGDTGMLSADFKLQLMIIETDIERLSYLVRLYLRIRLMKIDDFTIFYINETAEESQMPSNETLLSTEEKDYMQKHFKILTQLYNNSFLKKLPDYLTLLDDESAGISMITKPDLNVPVFIRVKSTKPIYIPLGDDEELELIENGIYVVKYKLIKKYLELGDVELI